MKKLIKKSVAIIEVIAMSIVLFAGFSFVNATEVKADGAILNFYQEFIVTSLDGKEEVTQSTPYVILDRTYCNLGDSVEFRVHSKDPWIGDIDIDLNEYSLEWYKVEEGDTSKEIKLDVSGLSYTVDGVKEADFYGQSDVKVYYLAKIYKNGEYIENLPFYLYDKSEYVRASGKTYYLSVGNDVTLKPELRDYYGNPKDISDGNYTFKWYKSTREEIPGENGTTIKNVQKVELGESDSSYTINNISLENLSHCIEYSTYYRVEYSVEIYQNEILKCTASFSLNDKTEILKVYGSNYTVSVGDSLTLTVALFDYDGNLLEEAPSDCTVKWYVRTDLNLSYLGETGLNYKIDKVSNKDFNESGHDVCYIARVYKSGLYKGETEFHIYDKDAKKINNDEINETVKAPAKTKINKITPKKKSEKKIKLSLKKIKGAAGYQVAVYETKKNAKKDKKAIVKKLVKKTKVTIKNKKLKNKNKLFVRARAYVLNGKTKKYGKWSDVKTVKIKK